MILYHWSTLGDIETFFPLTHFGTKEAALARPDTRFHRHEQGFLYTCELELPENCVQVEDWHTPRPLGAFLALCKSGYGELSQDMFAKITRDLRRDGIGEEVVLAGVLNLLDKYGVECLKYLNQHEGSSGDYSYCLVKPQVNILSVDSADAYSGGDE